jgi:hypothetical protein
VAAAIFRAVVHPLFVKARAASVAISFPIRALNSSEAQSHRKSAEGVGFPILIPTSLENVRPCRFMSATMIFFSCFAADLPYLLTAFARSSRLLR